MAIEKVKRTSFLVERGELEPFLHQLAKSKTTHIINLKEEPESENFNDQSSETNIAADAEAAHDKVNKLSRVLDILDSFAPPKRSFAQNFVDLPAEMRSAEFNRAVAETNPDQLHERATNIQHNHSAAAQKAEELRSRIGRLMPWAEADVPPPGLRRCGAELGTVPVKIVPKLENAARESGTLALSSIAASEGRGLVAAVWLKEAEEGAADLLNAYRFEPLRIEPGPGKIAAAIEKQQRELSEAEGRAEQLVEEAKELAGKRRAVLAALAHWQAEVERRTAPSKTLASKRIVLLSGYVRLREMEKLEELLSTRFPSVSLIAEDPQPGEEVPVSLGGSKLFAPAQFLTSMFGLPNYFEFDPSPYILFTFLLFFGCCFGDVIYGLMLMGLGWWLARKSADYPSLAKFCSLLALCGVASMVVGLLTGSWASDLLSRGYLGEGLAAVVNGIALVNPLERTVFTLLIVLGIGTLNQLFGMALLMYREWRKGNLFAAVCDGGLWLVFLPGLVLLLLSAAVEGVSPVLGNVALAMVVVSGLGLVLTQGRHEKSFMGKAVTGVVSLYGILGTYGTSSFIGDVLSYSRLLAIGLTTVIVGMSFNIIAGLLGAVPVVGVLLFVATLVFGHVFNFFISILTGFVHSVRLIFVEFFTKFYQAGAQPFVPLGAPQTVRVIDEG